MAELSVPEACMQDEGDKPMKVKDESTEKDLYVSAVKSKQKVEKCYCWRRDFRHKQGRFQCDNS
jgi:hypothetical protein